MTPHTYDQRPISEIRHDLLGTPQDEIDVISTLIVLCDRIDMLEQRISKNEKSVYVALNPNP